MLKTISSSIDTNVVEVSMCKGVKIVLLLKSTKLPAY